MVRQRLVTFLFLACVLPLASNGEAAEGINFFKNYFITGDYAVASVDLKPQGAVGGLISGNIEMSGVPANADIMAAFLYWETVDATGLTTTTAKFRGQNIGTFAVPIGQSPLAASTAPCWAKQGGGNTAVLTTWRADVLRLLPLDTNPGSLTFGKRLVNLSHEVSLPDAGTGNQYPESSGAGLVVIYRVPSMPLMAP